MPDTTRNQFEQRNQGDHATHPDTSPSQQSGTQAGKRLVQLMNDSQTQRIKSGQPSDQQRIQQIQAALENRQRQTQEANRPSDFNPELVKKAQAKGIDLDGFQKQYQDGIPVFMFQGQKSPISIIDQVNQQVESMAQWTDLDENSIRMFVVDQLSEDERRQYNQQRQERQEQTLSSSGLIREGDPPSETHHPFSHRYSGPIQTADAGSSQSQDHHPPSTIRSEDISLSTSDYFTGSYERESHGFPDQHETPDQNLKDTSSVYNRELLSRYPVVSIDENNKRRIEDYPVAEGDPNSLYAFIDRHDPAFSLHFSNNLDDARYRDRSQYIPLLRTEGLVQLCPIEYAVNLYTQQRDQRSQITQIASSTSENTQPDQPSQTAIQTQTDSQTSPQAHQQTPAKGKTKHKLQEESTIRRTGKTKHKLQEESTIRRTGKTKHKLQEESTIRRTGKTKYKLQEERSILITGKTPSELAKERSILITGKTRKQIAYDNAILKTGKNPRQITAIGKKFDIPGKTVAKILSLLKNLDQDLTQQREQQKILSTLTQSHDGTISLNERPAEIHNVPGHGMNCLLYAMLAANGYNIGDEASATHQIVQNTRNFLQSIGRAQENELLEMDTATSQGAEALAYLRSLQYMDSNQGLTIHATWQNPRNNQTNTVRQDVIPSTPREDGFLPPPIELYLDLQEHHYYYIHYLD